MTAAAFLVVLAVGAGCCGAKAESADAPERTPGELSLLPARFQEGGGTT